MKRLLLIVSIVNLIVAFYAHLGAHDHQNATWHGIVAIYLLILAKEDSI